MANNASDCLLSLINIFLSIKDYSFFHVFLFTNWHHDESSHFYFDLMRTLSMFRTSFNAATFTWKHEAIYFLLAYPSFTYKNRAFLVLQLFSRINVYTNTINYS